MTPRAALVAAVILALTAVAAEPVSEWVYYGPDHHLRYRTDEKGNRIMDFSHAGYLGGGVRIPDVPAVKTIKPAVGDNTAAIQEAIDAVAQLPLKANGFRGAVRLAAGTYEVARPLAITASGVVLQGSGSSDKGSVIRMTGTPHRFLSIRGVGAPQADGRAASIVDAYVPAGADSFRVHDAAGFRAGDRVLIERPVTVPWIHFMGMDTLVRDGKQQTWIKDGAVIHTDRVIRSVSGDRITLDVPLSDSLDAQFLQPAGATVVHYVYPGRIAQSGVESLRVVAPGLDVPITEGQFTILQMDAVADSWARDIEVVETQNSFTIGSNTRRITLDRIRIRHPTLHTGAAAPADFALSGTQALVNQCTVTGQGTWPLVTQAMVTGPNVVLHMTTGERGVSPHQRWATGLLVDSSNFGNNTERAPGIAYSNRKTAGSGHGWDIGCGVAWNVESTFLLVQQPPGSMNWCIGCIGKPVKVPEEPAGIFESTGTHVAPASLYIEQLRERLGAAAVANIGYK